MKKSLLILQVIWALLLCLRPAFSQTTYNPKNVDRTAMSFYDGLQTFRALEYTKDQDPQSEKVYRLQTLPENGFPAITLQATNQGSTVFFEDKAPYDDQFTDNSTPYLSSEAVQILSGFQRVMKTFDQRFGWKGSDGVGAVPIDIKMKNLFETDSKSRSYYLGNALGGYFGFERNLNDNKPFQITIDALAHEMTHSIIRYKTGIYSKSDISCSEYVAVNEGICNIFGIYVKNRIMNSTPQNYDWILAPQVLSLTFDTSNPKSGQFADTYHGQYYPASCVGEKPYHAGGVASRWFYLLSVGFQGSKQNDLGYTYSNLTGIGVEKAIKIIWDAIPSLKSFSNYPAFKLFTLQAAEKQYGLNSVEYQAVNQAWCAVGVCDNNQPFFTLSPPNATSGTDPWPGVSINFSWDDDKRIKEWEVETSTRYDFSENLQTIKVSSFDALFKPGGGVVYVGKATAHYHPGELIYVRAKITQADANFCKGLNPLCVLYQQFSPTHAVTLNDKKAQFWHAIPETGFTVNAWNGPTIYWKSVPNAEKYTYQVAASKDFANLVYTGTTNFSGDFTESGIINTTLGLNQKYYVRVRAERNNAVIINNFGAWSDIDSVNTYVPPTSVLQALSQKPNDPPTIVSSLGFGIDYYTTPGAFQYLVQVATDDAFSNIVRSQGAPGNMTNALVTLPNLADQTDLFVRVLPQKGFVYAKCTNVWHIKTDKNATLLAMSGPDPKISIPYKSYLGEKFFWAYGNVNPDLVDHFKLCIKENGSGDVITCFTTPGKALEKDVADQLMFDDPLGFKASVVAVGPQGAESGLSPSFSYTICPDQPFPKFPGDQSTINPALDVTVTWDASLWMKPGDSYLLSVLSNGVPINGFDNAPTTETSMVIPAGTLGNGKNYTYVVKNSGSCPDINAPAVLFSTLAGGNNNPPATPLKDLDIKVIGYRNDLDPADPFPIETSDYLLGVELRDPDGKIVQVVDANGNPVTEFWVNSENAILGLFKKDMPVGKYTLKVTMLNIPQPLAYNPWDQPHFSVMLNGKTVIDKHIITFNPLDPASPFHEWQLNFPFSPILLDHK